MFLRGALFGAISLLAACGQSEPGEPSLDDVIAQHTEARGGAAAIDRVKSAAIEVEITEGGQTFAIQYHASADPGPFARVDVIIEGNRVFSEGLDAEGVWIWPGDAPAATESVAEGAANALLHGVEQNLVGLHRFEDRGHALALMPRETVDAINYHVVEIAFSTGHKSYVYINPDSWMVERRRDERAYHPDVDQTKQRVESRFSDFTDVEGVLYSNRTEDVDLDTGDVLSTNRVLKREINPPLPDGLFDRTYDPAP